MVCGGLEVVWGGLGCFGVFPRTRHSRHKRGKNKSRDQRPETGTFPGPNSEH